MIEVNRVCTKEYEKMKTSGTRPFGQKMLINVENELDNLYPEILKVTPHCTTSHLQGAVAILTDECEVEWS